MSHPLTLITSWPHPQVLVVGDLMLDRYVFGAIERISPEAPVPVFREIEADIRPGGAANVASLLRRLDAEVRLFGVLGNDSDGHTLRNLLRDDGVDIDSILCDAERETTSKTRFVGCTASRSPHQLLRVDRERRQPPSSELTNRLWGQILDALCDCDGVLISDYAKGVCTPDLLGAVIAAARARNIPVLVDPARHVDYQRYAGATLITPNRPAAEAWCDHPLTTEDECLAVASRLRDSLRLDAAVLTLDRDGLAYADGEIAEIVSCRPRDVCDVTGAGDMVLAVLGLAAASGAPLRVGLEAANAAAGLEVERFGVVPLTRAEIVREMQGRSESKILSLEDLMSVLDGYRRAGRSIVFTNGCFDLLHPGHVGLLQEAAALGDVLVVAINSDDSVRRLKGPERPILRSNDRAQMLTALDCVGHVVIFDDDMPHELLRAIRPDVLVKGGTTVEIVGREVVESQGGRIVRLGTCGKWSTTGLIGQLRHDVRCGEEVK